MTVITDLLLKLLLMAPLCGTISIWVESQLPSISIKVMRASTTISMTILAPQQLIDSAGTIVWQTAYLPFGETQVLTEEVVNNLRFPGQYFDAETGLHYSWNKYYDPETRRYLSPDPIVLNGGINLYAYVLNNPVMFIDPLEL